jgi:hypothetical protein
MLLAVGGCALLAGQVRKFADKSGPDELLSTSRQRPEAECYLAMNGAAGGGRRFACEELRAVSW